jgi:hypothetical protein
LKTTWIHSHSGVFARSITKAVRYYQSLGLASDFVPPRDPPKGKLINIEFGQEMNNKPAPGEPSFLQLIYIGEKMALRKRVCCSSPDRIQY